MLHIVSISDTHRLHNQIQIPECDILIHSGDYSFYGEWLETVDFLQWFADQPAKHKIFIAGNHEQTLDPLHDKRNPEIQELVKSWPGLIYLQDSGIEIEGKYIYGTSYTPYFFDWGFNGIASNDPEKRGSKHLIDVYAAIPDHTSILITHGPCINILDKNRKGQHCGSLDLLNRAQKLEHLDLLVFGHIHHSRGSWSNIPGFAPSATLLNASSTDDSYILRDTPYWSTYLL